MADTVIITGEKTVTVVTVGVQGPAGISGSSIPATNTTLGGIIVGDNLSITGNGVLSVADTFQPKTSCVTYGLTDTLLPSGPNTFYVRGEHVVQSEKNSYTGLRGRKTSAGYQNATFYGVGSYNVDSNGTPTRLSTLETSSSGVLLSVSDLTTLSVASTIAMSAGYLQLQTSNGSLAGSPSLVLEDGMVKIKSGSSGFVQLAGNNNPPGSSDKDYTFSIASDDDLTDGVSIRRRTQTTSLEFPYIVSNATARFSFGSGLFFFNGDPLSAATELQHKYTNTFSNTTSSTKIRLVRNNAELSFAEMSQVKTTNSILTQGYADTRYQAVGAYLTSANLTFANLTGTPTTLAGYGITDGLTSSSANSTYAVLGHTHAISEVTGLQTALDAKLPSANFTYANITGKPTLATVATTGSYTDLTNTPASYSLPTASTTVLGGVKVDGSSIVINSGIISSTYSYSLPAATTSTLGGVRLGTGVNLDANGFLISDVKLSSNTFTGTQNLGGNLLTQPKLQAYRETSTAPTISSGTLTLDLSGSNFFAVSLNAAITTLTISNTPASSAASFTLELTADGTARAVTWGAAIKWSGGTAPTLTSTSGKKDVFAFYSNDGGTTWQGFIGGQNF